MYLIPLFIILVGLGIIIFIVARKFPPLTHLDVEHLPEERQTRKKKEILSQRVELEAAKLQQAWQRRLQPIRRWWGKLQLKFRIYVGKIERLWHHEQKRRPAAPVKLPGELAPEQAKLQALVQEANQELAEGHWDQAEELFIAAIKKDQQATPSYRGLADTYAAKGALAEARETYQFILKLNPKDDAVMVKLAELAEQEGKIEEAIGWYEQAVLINDALSPRFYHLAELLLAARQPQTAVEAIRQAVELEPKNPKYLDLLVESAILGGDKDLALKAYHELRLVNPENQKLKSFKERVYKM